MATTDELIPYEILIRFGDDGAPRGAHVQHRRVVTVDGEVVLDEARPAQPLGLVDFPTSAILSEATEAALAQINVLEAAAQSAQLMLEAAQAEKTAAEAARDAAQAHVAILQADLAAANASLAQANATIGKLTMPGQGG
jgi:hypothetical protein